MEKIVLVRLLETMPVKMKIKNKNSVNIKKLCSSNRGVALVEMLPILVICVVLVSVTIGLWGITYSAVLQSVSARHYAFEVLNNRSHFEYHRDYDPNTISGSGAVYGISNKAEDKDYHGNIGMRLFMVVGDTQLNPGAPFATERNINLFSAANPQQTKGGLIKSSKKDPNWHNNSTWGGGNGKDFRIEPVNPIWIMTGYGICLNYSCGDEIE